MDRIYCDLCGFEFDTQTKIEQHYHDYELEDVMITYPVKTKGRRPILMRNYICSECMDNLDSVLLNKLIQNGEKYLGDSEKRKEKVRKKYEEELEGIRQRDMHIENCVKGLKNSKSILDFSDSFLHELYANDDVFRPYYLERGLTFLIERKKYRVSDLCRKYGISFSKLISPYGMESLVTLKEFKNIVENSVSELSFSQLSAVIEQINQDI